MNDNVELAQPHKDNVETHTDASGMVAYKAHSHILLI